MRNAMIYAQQGYPLLKIWPHITCIHIGLCLISSISFDICLFQAFKEDLKEIEV